jgi:hypothetical protein
MTKNILFGLLAVAAGITYMPQPAQAVIYTETDIHGVHLRDGDMISASTFGDPDIYIISDAVVHPVSLSGYKRLFLNPEIFGMYAHLGGFSKVHPVTTAVRDHFETSGFFRNCETNNQKVWATEVTGEDSGVLHHVQIDGAAAAQQDPYFFSKVFCINTREENFYPHSINPYTALNQVPSYSRTPADCYYQPIQCITTPCEPVLVCPMPVESPVIIATYPDNGPVGSEVRLFAPGATQTGNTISFGGRLFHDIPDSAPTDGTPILRFQVPSDMAPGSYSVWFSPGNSNLVSSPSKFEVTSPTASFTITSVTVVTVAGSPIQYQANILGSLPNPCYTAYTRVASLPTEHRIDVLVAAIAGQGSCIQTTQELNRGIILGTPYDIANTGYGYNFGDYDLYVNGQLWTRFNVKP